MKGKIIYQDNCTALNLFGLMAICDYHDDNYVFQKCNTITIYNITNTIKKDIKEGSKLRR